MPWYSPSTWYETAAGVYDTGYNLTASLFASAPQQASAKDNGAALGLFEPGFEQDVIDWDPSEPWTQNTPGNHGCFPGYYVSYDAGGKVCRRYGYDGRKLVGYDATESERNATSWGGSVTRGFASALALLATPVTNTVEGIKKAAAGVGGLPWLKGSYVVIGILVALALVLLMGSRLISKAEGR